MSVLKQTKTLKLKAWGLVEILIAMTIFAVAIISITSLNARNYTIIKNNELADQANKVMISAVEYFKAPAANVQTFLTTNVTGTEAKSFWLDVNSNVIDASRNDLQFQWISSTTPEDFANCTNSSAYKVTFKAADGTISAFLVCLKVDIKKQNNGFQIVSYITYFLSSVPTTNSIVGYRPFTYLDTTPAP